MKKMTGIIISFISFFSCFQLSADTLESNTLFIKMDTDNDGYINRNEINRNSLLSIEFDKVDKDNDGNLNPQEFENYLVSIDLT